MSILNNSLSFIKKDVRRILNKFTSHYVIYSLGISFLIFSSFIFFTTRGLIFFPLDFHTLLETSSLSLLIGYQILGIKYLSLNIQPTFLKLKHIFKNKEFKIFCDYLEERYQITKMFYLVIIFVIVPFILIEINVFWGWKFSMGPTPPYFFLFEPYNRWSIVLDILNNLISHLMLLLLAIIIWMIINLIIIVNELDKNTSIFIDIFHVDEMGGLKPLRNFITIIVSNYFIIITLAIISYISPKAVFSYETIFLINMLFLGVVLFVITQKTINNMINKGFEFELSRIHKEYKKAHNNLINIITDDNESNEDELEKLSYVLDLLEKENNRVIKQRSLRKFEFKFIFTFIGSFLIPAITLIEKIQGLIN